MDIMSESSHPICHSDLPTTGLVAIAKRAIGFSVGLLVGERLSRSSRQVAALVGFAVGAAALTPVISRVAVSLANGPTSSRRMRHRLDSIRHDTGLAENLEEF